MSASTKPPCADAVRDWSGRLRGIAAEFAASPSHAGAHRAYAAGAEAPRIVEGFTTLVFGVLRNVTLEPWLPELYVALLQRGVKAAFRLGDYSVYERYAAAPAELGAPEPNWFLVYLDPEALVGDARHDPPPDLAETVARRVRGIVGGLLEHTGANVVVSALAPEPHAVHRLHGDQDPVGWPQQRRAVNAALVEAFSPEPRVSILDMDRIVAEYGVANAHDSRMRLVARSPFAVNFLPVLARELADLVAAQVLPPKKCVVVDCDNTLWGGVLGEDGPEGVRVGKDYPGSAYREFQLFLAGLARRGFLLSLNSKNNETDVLSFMESSPEMVLRPRDFAARRINWRDKAANLGELARELNIGLDSMIFIDDSPVECARVREALPEVQVERFPSQPVDIPAFSAGLTGVERLRAGRDDLIRAQSIRAGAERERLRRETPDLDSFIRGLEIELVIARQDRSAAQRVSELSQRTNQFNLTTRRYGVGDIERFMDEGVVYAMSMKDRFSDYGIIGVAIVTGGPGRVREIDSFMLSCRAFGRKIEGALLGAMLDDAARGGAEVVRARHIATPRNGMTRNFFAEHGFAVTGESDRERRFEIRPSEIRPNDRMADDPEPLHRIWKEGFPT